MKRKSGFTMIEIILILMIISTALITIISGVNRTIRYVSETKQRTIALNLAKEGIEAVYNIRNTNWRRRSSQKDECRLKANPMMTLGVGDDCKNSERIYEGNRSLEYETPDDQNKPHYYKLERREDYKDIENYNNIYANLENNPTEIQLNYKLYNVNGERIPHSQYSTLVNPKTSNTTEHFWRVIRVQGLYGKEEAKELDCKRGNTNNCGDSTAKELRFCSTVIYSRPYQGTVNICAIMTNFLE